MSDAAEWDEAIAADLVGSLVIAELTYERPDGETLRELQTYGVVTAVDRDEGVVIEVHGETWKGQTMVLPATTDAYEKVPPGTYRLEMTGETVVDPDYTTSWTFTEMPS